MPLNDYPSVANPAAGDYVYGFDVSEATGSRDARFLLSALSVFFGETRFGVSETGHGFSVGDLVYRSSGAWGQADASTVDKAAYQGMVVEVLDVDSFTLQTAGLVTGLSGLTDADLLYLQDDGSLGTTPGTIRVPVLRALSASSGVLLPATRSRDVAFTDAGNSGATITLDWNEGEIQRVTLTDSPTISFANKPPAGTLRLEVVQDGTGSRTVTWPAAVEWAGGSAPTLTTAANALDVIDLYTPDGGTTVRGRLFALNVS